MARLGLHGTVTRRRLVGLLSGAFLLAATGCESPPPPSVAERTRTSGPSRSGLKSIELAPAPKSAGELEQVKVASRVQAGLDTVRIQVGEIAEDAPAGAQAALVRKAIEREPPAILIEAPVTPDPELAAAAAEARAAGIPVVIMGRPLDDSTAAGPGRSILVVPRPFHESAADLVKLAMRNAGVAELDPKGGAAILVETHSDPLFEDRVAALKEALKDAGVDEVGEVRFDRDPASARSKLADHLNAHPKTSIVMGSDGVALNAAYDAAEPLAAEHPYVIAGYSADEQGGRIQVQTGDFAGLGVYAPDRLIRKGINVAAHLMRGSKVADRIEIETVVLSSAPGSGLPKPKIEPLPPDESD